LAPISVCAPALLLALAATAEAGPHGPTRVLMLSQKAAASPDETHSGLVVTRRIYAGRVAFAGRVRTVRQLRTGSPPNPWECAWIVWNYRDEAHFYYLALKPNGWELGKRDPDHPGGQRFLASGSRRFPLGAWHTFAIGQHGATIEARADGVRLVTFADTERAYPDGRLGIYAEDAEVEVDDIARPFADDFGRYRLQTNTQDGTVMGQWITPFLGFGYAAIVDRRK
jgi:hypothetical protein